MILVANLTLLTEKRTNSIKNLTFQLENVDIS